MRWPFVPWYEYRADGVEPPQLVVVVLPLLLRFRIGERIEARRGYEIDAARRFGYLLRFRLAFRVLETGWQRAQPFT